MNRAQLPGGRTYRRAGALRVLAFAMLAFAVVALCGCRKKATRQQCEEMLDRFAELVVKERFPDAGPDVLEAERVRERRAAKSDDAFKNCPSAVQTSELECAMRAESSEAILTCLE